MFHRFFFINFVFSEDHAVVGLKISTYMISKREQDSTWCIRSFSIRFFNIFNLFEVKQKAQKKKKKKRTPHEQLRCSNKSKIFDLRFRTVANRTALQRRDVKVRTIDICKHYAQDDRSSSCWSYAVNKISKFEVYIPVMSHRYIFME